MLALAEILALIILNALVHTAFTRWRIARRPHRAQQPERLRIVMHYPLHPSPVGAPPFHSAAEHAAHIRPAGVDW